MARVLVTGASGFIGTHLVAALAARGDEVACLVRNRSKAEHLQTMGARLVCGDVTDCSSLPAAVSGQQIVYHLAGLTRTLDDRQFYEVNYRGAAHVAKECARQQTPPVLVHVSSLAAAGPVVDGRPRVESDLPAPTSHYGRSKRSGEHAAEGLADRLPITIIRPPIVLGQGDAWGVSLFRYVLRMHVHMVPGFRPERFSVIHADDLVQLLMLAAERGRRLPPLGQDGCAAGQGYYFAASEQDPTYADLGRLVAQSVGRRVLVIPTAMPVVRVVAAGYEAISRVSGLPMPLSRDKVREIAAGSWVCSAQAAKNDLGFAVAAPLVERLRQTVEWYQQEGWL